MSTFLSVVSFALTWAAVALGSVAVLGLLLYGTAEAVRWCIQRAGLWVALIAFFRWRARPARKPEEEIAEAKVEARLRAELDEARRVLTKRDHAVMSLNWALAKIPPGSESLSSARDSINEAIHDLGGDFAPTEKP
jgi:type VI protein secretion system component VasK